MGNRIGKIPRRTLTVDGGRLLYFLLILPTIMPFGLSTYLNIYTAVNISKLISLVLLLILWIVYDHRINRYMFYTFLFVISLFTSTLINNQDIYRCATYTVGIINVVVWMHLVVQRGYFDEAIKDVKNFSIFIVIINIISYIYAPNGITTVFTGNAYSACDLISNNNSIAPFIVPACFLCVFYDLLTHKDSFIKELICFIVFFCVLFYVVTGAGMFISLTTTILYFLMRYNERFKRMLSVKRIGISLLILFVIICVFQATTWLGALFTAFDSSVTLTGRTLLWEYGIKMIAQKPIFGYGIAENNYMQGYLRIVTVHNMYFQVAIWGGIISVSLMVISFLEAVKSVFKYWNDRYDLIPLSLGIIGVLIYFMVEVHVSVPYFWILLSLANYYEEMIIKREQDESNN